MNEAPRLQSKNVDSVRQIRDIEPDIVVARIFPPIQVTPAFVVNRVPLSPTTMPPFYSANEIPFSALVTGLVSCTHSVCEGEIDEARIVDRIIAVRFIVFPTGFSSRKQKCPLH